MCTPAGSYGKAWTSASQQRSTGLIKQGGGSEVVPYVAWSSRRGLTIFMPCMAFGVSLVVTDNGVLGARQKMSVADASCSFLPLRDEPPEKRLGAPSRNLA